MDQQQSTHVKNFEQTLSENAEWKKIQQNTLTRWINKHLNKINIQINNLATDLSSGIILIKLLEILTNKKLPKYHEQPTFRSHQLENVGIALKFLIDENISIVNIDSSDIVDGNLKLILGLVYTLIFHYSMSTPDWELGKDKSPQQKINTKRKLFTWIRSKIPELAISNFTSDWNNGVAVGALVNAVAPGLCSDWQQWDPKNSLTNTTQAMNIANDYLSVTQLISPEEMTDINIDEISMMTYLLQFHTAKLKQSIHNQALEVALNSTRTKELNAVNIVPISHKIDSPKESIFNVYGAGILSGVTGQSTKFTIATHNAASSHECNKKKDTNQVDRIAPFKVKVKNLNVKKIPDEFKENVNNSVQVKLDANIAGTDNNFAPINLTDNNDGTYTVEYFPLLPGSHEVTVTFEETTVVYFPIIYDVLSHDDVLKIKIIGLDLNPGSWIRNEFTIDTRAVHEIEKNDYRVLKCSICDPTGLSIDNFITHQNDGLFKVEYMPFDFGKHSIELFYDNFPIPGSPFIVNVVKICIPGNCKAYGPGLIKGMVNMLNYFTIDLTDAGTGGLDVIIEGPINEAVSAKIQYIEDSTVKVEYVPSNIGSYDVIVEYGEVPIPGSPFIVNIVDN